MPINDIITRASYPLKPFGERVREARKAQAVTRSELAERVGVSKTAVRNWEMGSTRPKPGKLAKIASVLGVSETFLKTGTDRNRIETAVPELLPSIIEEARQKNYRVRPLSRHLMTRTPPLFSYFMAIIPLTKHRCIGMVCVSTGNRSHAKSYQQSDLPR
jgi:transcriptional regulator with XRE-family HTH domain